MRSRALNIAIVADVTFSGPAGAVFGPTALAPRSGRPAGDVTP
jgi:hypothetical protein